MSEYNHQNIPRRGLFADDINQVRFLEENDRKYFQVTHDIAQANVYYAGGPYIVVPELMIAFKPDFFDIKKGIDKLLVTLNWEIGQSYSKPQVWAITYSQDESSMSIYSESVLTTTNDVFMSNRLEVKELVHGDGFTIMGYDVLERIREPEIDKNNTAMFSSSLTSAAFSILGYKK